MTSELKCPFCGEKLYKSNDCHVCFNANCIFANNYLFDEKWWAITKLKQALIQSQQQLKMLEPIVASLQGRADINAEVARDSNELVVQWYEKYEQTQKDLEIATKALENIVSDYEVDASNGWLAANAKKALEQIRHKE